MLSWKDQISNLEIIKINWNDVEIKTLLIIYTCALEPSLND